MQTQYEESLQSFDSDHRGMGYLAYLFWYCVVENWYLLRHIGGKTLLVAIKIDALVNDETEWISCLNCSLYIEKVIKLPRLCKLSFPYILNPRTLQGYFQAL